MIFDHIAVVKTINMSNGNLLIKWFKCLNLLIMQDLEENQQHQRQCIEHKILLEIVRS